MRRGWLIAGVLAAFAASPALAQAPPSDDPIGDLLAKQTEALEPPPPPPAPRSVKGGVTRELSDAAYDARIRASMEAARRVRGPLEGGWTIAGAGGDLFDLQLSERKGVIEGAWRDLSHAGAPGASGYIDAVERSGDDLTVRFADGRLTALLHAQPDGLWSGELTGEGSGPRPIRLKRRGP